MFRKIFRHVFFLLFLFCIQCEATTVENPEHVKLKDQTLKGNYCINYGYIFNQFERVHGIVGGNATLINANGAKIYIGGDGASAMLGSEDSELANKGSIQIGNSWSPAILAETGSYAVNEGSIDTFGRKASGLQATGKSSIENTGTIYTRGAVAYGMDVSGPDSHAGNSGSIITTGKDASGIKLMNHADGQNTSSGSIHTEGENAAGAWATMFSVFANAGLIVTDGKAAPGIKGVNGADVDNTGIIKTAGFRSEGMYILNESLASSSGAISTTGEGAHGVFAGMASTVGNNGTVSTTGASAHGMYSWNGSTILTGENSTVTTSGSGSHGMVAERDSSAENAGAIHTTGDTSAGISGHDKSLAINSGTIVTEGAGASGILAENSSIAANSGFIMTRGKAAHGVIIATGSMGDNEGVIETYGEAAHGMYISEGSKGNNIGMIRADGSQADAVFLDDSSFTNSGVLASTKGNALTAQNGSTAILRDGTTLPRSRNLEGDETSRLIVDMNTNILAKVDNFGHFTKTGAGTMTIEGRSSCGETFLKQGTLKLDQNSRLTTDTYTQAADATLAITIGPGSRPGSAPFWVENTATLDGALVIDASAASDPGFYDCIRASDVRGGFNTISFANTQADLEFYQPRWLEGGSLHLTAMAGYPFSEQALGIAAAIDGWSVFRRATSDRFNDFFMQARESSKETGVSYHGDFVMGETRRDSSKNGTAGYDSRTSGLFFGTKNRIDDDIQWGLFAGYTEQEINFTDLPSVAADWEKQKTWHLGGYIGRRWENWVISDTLAWHSTGHESFRRQTGDDAWGEFSSWSVTNDLRAMYLPHSKKANQGWQIIPEVGLNTGYFKRNGYSEMNGFTYGDFSTTVVESLLGLRVSKDFVTKEGTNLNTQLQLTWTRNLSGSDISIDRSWKGDTKWYKENLPGDDLFSAELMLSFYSKNDPVCSLSCRGRFSEDFHSWNGKISLEWLL
ncbi:MAG: autotransporter outer membrane beta-barrel domain-containing protein [Thermovirgaceae bacterium]